MKHNFINLQRDPALEDKSGFNDTEKKEIKAFIAELETSLATKNQAVIEDTLKKHKDEINAASQKFADWQVVKDAADAENQKALDKLLSQVGEIQRGTSDGRIEAKSLQAAMIEALKDPENLKGINDVRRGQRFKMMLKGPINLSMAPEDYYDGTMLHKMESGLDKKTVGNMTSAGNLTGQGFINYNNRQVILPSQKVNARDLVPTVRSETGTYVTFRETAGEGSISRQTTHGALKTQIDFDFARVEVVSEYIAGFTRFAKQLMRQLPFLQNTLPRLLIREFYKVENRRFWDIMATADNASPIPPAPIKQEPNADRAALPLPVSTLNR